MADQQISCPGCGSSAWDDIVVTAVGVQATCLACERTASMNTPRQEEGQPFVTFEGVWRE